MAAGPDRNCYVAGAFPVRMASTIRVRSASLTAPTPKDYSHVHFGGGQTETEITLPPGKHRLQLVLGDAGHVPHNPPVMSDTITIEVR